jgi:transposase
VGKPGLKKIHRYSVEFKLTAVKLSRMAGVEVQTVANALDIHPFMLSRWRKEVRDGVLKGRAHRVDLPSRPAREIKQLQALKREYAMLREEHELLKKAIRFCSARRQRSSRSSTHSVSSAAPGGYARSTA